MGTVFRVYSDTLVICGYSDDIWGTSVYPASFGVPAHGFSFVEPPTHAAHDMVTSDAFRVTTVYSVNTEDQGEVEVRW